MASDEAIREGSRAWSGGWLSHRLAAAQHLACELSDDVNPCRAVPRAPCPVPVPEPLSLDSRALAPIRPERPSPPTSTSYLLPFPSPSTD
ncbi:hypothetical protein TYRP_002699 [Tyrophagus putrescentiae]|nr:hypothetical protein TYRP_002699 [Tyrophagus putrescentiae]